MSWETKKDGARGIMLALGDGSRVGLSYSRLALVESSADGTAVLADFGTHQVGFRGSGLHQYAAALIHQQIAAVGLGPDSSGGKIEEIFVKAKEEAG
jgi:hypothetical protein